MTSLKGDLRSIMGTPFGGVGHAVLIFSRVTRAAFNSDSVVLQLHDRIEMPEDANGKFQVDGLDPGPIRIELEGGTVHNHGWNIDLPDEGVWSLTDLVDAQVDWSPAVIGRAEAAAREARDHADRAEAGADRVGTAEQVGVWASAAASAMSGAVTARDAAQSARDVAEGHANRAATSETNAKTSETNAKQSETNAGDYAAVATTAATEAVDAMEEAALSAAAFDIYTGTGAPEGKVAAPVGAIYTDSAATNGAIRWIKTSGTSNTGWRVEYGDTGQRVITHNGAGGTLRIRRVGNTVTVGLNEITLAKGTAAFILFAVPPGFQPADRISLVTHHPKWEDIPSVWGSYNGLPSNFSWLRKMDGSLDRPTIATSGTVTFLTDNPWPTSLPGIPA